MKNRLLSALVLLVGICGAIFIVWFLPRAVFPSSALGAATCAHPPAACCKDTDCSTDGTMRCIVNGPGPNNNYESAYCTTNYGVPGGGSPPPPAPTGCVVSATVACCGNGNCASNERCVNAGFPSAYCTASGTGGAGGQPSTAGCDPGTLVQNTISGVWSCTHTYVGGTVGIIYPCDLNVGGCSNVYENFAAADAQAEKDGCTGAQQVSTGSLIRPDGLNYYYTAVGCPGGGSGSAGGASGSAGSGGAGVQSGIISFLTNIVNALKAQLGGTAAAGTAGTTGAGGQTTLGQLSGFGSASSTVGGAGSSAQAPITIEVSPLSRNVGSVGSVTYAITVHSNLGIDSPVDLSVSGLPKGVGAFFTPQQVSSDEGTSVLTVNVSSSAIVDIYSLRVTGRMNDGSQKSTSFSITIGATKNLDTVGPLAAAPSGTVVFGMGATTSTVAGTGGATGGTGATGGGGYDFASANIGGLASQTFQYLAFKTAGSVKEVEAYDSSGAKINPVKIDISPGSNVAPTVLADGDTNVAWPGPIVNQMSPGVQALWGSEDGGATSGFFAWAVVDYGSVNTFSKLRFLAYGKLDVYVSSDKNNFARLWSFSSRVDNHWSEYPFPLYANGGGGGSAASAVGAVASNPSQSCATTLNPGDSIQSAVNCNPAGTTFTLTPGVYRGQDVAAKASDTFVGQPGAILNGSKLLTNFTQRGNLWVATGQTQRVLTPSGEVEGRHGDCAASHPACNYPEDLYFDNVPLWRVDSASDVVAGKWYFDYNAGTVYLGSNPAGHTVELGTMEEAIRGAVAGVTVSNLIVEKYANTTQVGAIGGNTFGPDQGQSNWTIQNCEIRLNHGDGATIADGAHIVGSYIHNNGAIGYNPWGGGNIIFENNELSFNGVGAKPMFTTNLTVRNNYVHDNSGPGLWTDADNVNTAYTGNVIVNNQVAGIEHEISFAATITNNTLINNGAGGDPNNYSWLKDGSQILLYDSQNVVVSGNTLVVPQSSGNGIGLVDTGDRGASTNPALGAYLLKNNSIRNNDITYSGGSGLTGTNNNNSATAFGNVFDNNRYHAADTTVNHFVSLWPSSLSFAAFQQQGQETHGTMDATISAHPLVIPAGVSNNPAAVSPIIPAGVGNVYSSAYSGMGPSVALSVNGASSVTLHKGDPFNVAWNISNADYFDASFSGGPDIFDYWPGDVKCQSYMYSLRWVNPVNAIVYGPTAAGYNIPAAPYSQTVSAGTIGGVPGLNIDNDCGIVGRTFTATITGTQSLTGKSSTASAIIHVPGSNPYPGVAGSPNSISDLWNPLIIIDPNNFFSADASFKDENLVSMGGNATIAAEVWVQNNDWGIYPNVAIDSVSPGLTVSYEAIPSPSEIVSSNHMGTAARIGTLKITLKPGASLPQQIQLVGIYGGVSKPTTVNVTE